MCTVSSGVSERDQRRQLHHDDGSALTGRRTGGTLTAAGNCAEDLMYQSKSFMMVQHRLLLSYDVIPRPFS